MSEEIQTFRQLREVYPLYSEYLDRMYAQWMITMTSGVEDEVQAGKSFVKHFVGAIPTEQDLEHLMQYAQDEAENQENEYGLACWLILIANDPEIKNGGKPDVDADLFEGWRSTR